MRIFTVVLLLISSSIATADGLNIPVRTYLPSDIVTIRQAFDYLLSPTDYSISDYSPNPVDAGEIFNHEPYIRGTREIMKVEDALLEIIGPKAVLYVDRVNKLVNAGFIR